MKQTKLINLVTEKLINLKYIAACYLGGSFGRHTEDDYSNVDLYCNFQTGYEEDYEKIKLELFEEYAPIVYFKKDKNIDIVIFNDGLIFKLHHVYPNLDGIIEIDSNNYILYNPINVLKLIQKNSLSYTNEQIGEVIDNLSIKVLEFYRNYMKNDYPLILRLASDIHYDYSCIKHFVSNNNDAKLAAKGIMNNLDQEERKKYIEILRYYSFDKLKEFIILILNDLNTLLANLPISVAQCFNNDLFDFIRKKIGEL